LDAHCVQVDGETPAPKHSLTFPQSNPQYIFDRMVVAFWGMDGKTRVRFEIRLAALDDHFKGDNTEDKVEVFKANQNAIEDKARQKYLGGDTEPDGSILIRTSDFI
jgi:Protein of unknown function (DUF1488)